MCIKLAMAKIHSLLARFIYALKPKSWPKLLVPAVLGQVIGILISEQFSLSGCLLGFTITLFQLIYIVLLNDWADVSVDTLKRNLFPEGCSPKTIPDKILGSQTVFFAGLGAGCLLLAVALGGEIYCERPGLLLSCMAGMFLFAIYSLIPPRFNYRGGGEFVEMLGVGVCVPWINAYAQSGVAYSPYFAVVLPGFALLALTSAIASGLSDEQSDRLGGKVTITTHYGNTFARTAIERLLIFAVFCWLIASRLSPDLLSPFVVMPVCFIIFANLGKMTDLSEQAKSNCFLQQARYKQFLHRAVWGGGLVLAMGMLINYLWNRGY